MVLRDSIHNQNLGTKIWFTFHFLNFPSISQWICRFSVIRKKTFNTIRFTYVFFSNEIGCCLQASRSVLSAMCQCFQIVKFIYVLTLDAITVTVRNVRDGNNSVFCRWGFESLQPMLDGVRFGRTSAETSQMPVASARHPQVSSRKFILFIKSSSPK